MKKIEDFVFRFFNLCGLQPMEIRKGIFQVHIDDALAKELDGWRAKGRLFQFTFNKNLAETYGAELVNQGSYRLNTIIQLTKKQAVLTEGYLPLDTFYEPAIRSKILSRFRIEQPGYRWYVIDYKPLYGPYLWFTILITRLAYEKLEDLRKISIDLVNGNVINYQIPADLLKPGQPKNGEHYKRRLSYKQAYNHLQQGLIQELSLSDPTWAINASRQLEQEQEQLEEYFESLPNSEERNTRITELMNRAKPRIQIKPLRAAYLHLPKLEYRIMQVGEEEKLNRVMYDPVSNQIQLG